MGRDKALLPFGDRTLAEHVAVTVARAAGSVTLIGDPGTYRGLGYPVVADAETGCGPLAGIRTALTVSRADWNLVVACDMPGLEAPFLESLLDAAEQRAVDCLLPEGPTGRPEPLCAVYHRRSLPAIRRALDAGVRKVLDGLAGLRLEFLPVDDSALFRNLNTPEEWSSYTTAQTCKTREKGD